MNLILLLLLLLFNITNLSSTEIILKCENNYSYKIINKSKIKIFFLKNNSYKWTEIKSFSITEDKLDLYIPNMKYLGCSDKTLPICKYGMRIKNYTGGSGNKRTVVTEVVLNDCYIGTMGCNAYKKNLELNKSFCQIN